MKRLILSIVILLTTLTATCQNDTSKTDSLVLVPKSTMIKVIKDLERGDACAENYEVLADELINVNHKVTLKQALIDDYKRKELSYKREISSNEFIIDNKDKLLDNALADAKKQKRQKNWIIGGGTTLVVGVTVGIIVLATVVN